MSESALHGLVPYCDSRNDDRPSESASPSESNAVGDTQGNLDSVASATPSWSASARTTNLTGSDVRLPPSVTVESVTEWEPGGIPRTMRSAPPPTSLPSTCHFRSLPGTADIVFGSQASPTRRSGAPAVSVSPACGDATATSGCLSATVTGDVDPSVVFQPSLASTVITPSVVPGANEVSNAYAVSVSPVATSVRSASGCCWKYTLNVRPVESTSPELHDTSSVWEPFGFASTFVTVGASAVNSSSNSGCGAPSSSIATFAVPSGTSATRTSPSTSSLPSCDATSVTPNGRVPTTASASSRNTSEKGLVGSGSVGASVESSSRRDVCTVIVSGAVVWSMRNASCSCVEPFPRIRPAPGGGAFPDGGGSVWSTVRRRSNSTPSLMNRSCRSWVPSLLSNSQKRGPRGCTISSRVCTLTIVRPGQKNVLMEWRSWSGSMWGLSGWTWNQQCSVSWMTM